MSAAEVLLIPISVGRRNKEYVAVFFFFFFTTCMAVYIVLDSVDLSGDENFPKIREEELNSGL